MQLKLGKSDRVFIIAEAGVNHNGSLRMAKSLVSAAANAGADAVKFQTFRAADLVTPGAGKAEYQKKSGAAGESQQAMLKKLELNLSMHKELIAHCRQCGIVFLSSPFDEASADMLLKLGVSAIKIPSGEIVNKPYLEHIGRKKKPIILSTGMSTLGEVERALDTIYSTGNCNVALLHCVTEYPAPFAEINLRAMQTLQQSFCVPVGYSDHSVGIEIVTAAVALGAVMIEKHFTLDRSLPGPDHKASLEPDELSAMVVAVRHVSAALGNGIKRPARCELKNLAVARKSCVAKIDLLKGETLSAANVALKRPGTGISPYDLDRVLGRKLKRALSANQVITWHDLE